MWSATNTPTHFEPISAESQRAITQNVCPMRYESADRVSAQRAQLKSEWLAHVNVIRYESHGVEHGARTRAHIQNHPADYFLLCLPLQAQFRFQHGGTEAVFAQGEAVLLSSLHPFDGYVAGPTWDSGHSSVHARIPGSMLRSRVPNVDALCNRVINMATGTGKILQSTLCTTVDEAQTLTERQAQRHSHVLADLVANCVDHVQSGTASTAIQTDPLGHVYQRACAFIDAHLSNPELDVEAVAAHCHVSTRYLHKIFATRAVTLASTVREWRLQRCRQALQDPQLRERSVIDIAYDWGFCSPSHFSRLYKQRFGLSPSADRPPDRCGHPTPLTHGS